MSISPSHVITSMMLWPTIMSVSELQFASAKYYSCTTGYIVCSCIQSSTWLQYSHGIPSLQTLKCSSAALELFLDTSEVIWFHIDFLCSMVAAVQLHAFSAVLSSSIISHAKRCIQVHGSPLDLQNPVSSCVLKNDCPAHLHRLGWPWCFAQNLGMKQDLVYSKFRKVRHVSLHIHSPRA